MKVSPVKTRKGEVVYWRDASGEPVHYVCTKCERGYKYGDSLDRHMLEKHPKVHQRAEARRLKLARETQARARRHKELCYDIVEKALAWNRSLQFPDRVDTVGRLKKACAALEKFEKGRR